LSVIFDRGLKTAAVFVALFLSAAGVALAQEDTPERPKAPERPAMGSSDYRAKGEMLVSGAVNTYRNYNRASFTDLIADDYPGDKYAFVNSVESSYYAAMPMKVDHFVNKVTPAEDKIAVSFRWNKTSIQRGKGTLVNASGDCVFVFKKEDDGWAIYDIKGSSPF
jgi:hypothetical protein